MPAWRGCNCCSVRRPGVRRLQQHFLLRSCYSHHSMLYCGHATAITPCCTAAVLQPSLHAVLRPCYNHHSMLYCGRATAITPCCTAAVAGWSPSAPSKSCVSPCMHAAFRCAPCMQAHAFACAPCMHTNAFTRAQGVGHKLACRVARMLACKLIGVGRFTGWELGLTVFWG